MASLLVVDDDADVLEATCAVLKAAGHSVSGVPDALAALEIIESKAPIDLLMTDVVMPGLHGFGLARMALIRRPDLKILYVSGHSELKEADDAAQLGRMLCKPVKPDGLRREVDEALSGGTG